MKRPGRTRVKLAALLEAQGFRVDPLDLRPAQGAWRTDKRLDTNPWEGIGTAHNHPTFPEGWQIIFSGESTMTRCVRYGLQVTEDTRASYGYVNVSMRSSEGT